MRHYQLFLLLVFIFAGAACMEEDENLQHAVEADSTIPLYRPRFGRVKPIITVVGENTFTELTDFVVPYGVLKEAGVANVMTLGTKKGVIQMFPALRLEPHYTISDFDIKYPSGADYVFVPAVHRSDDEALMSWIKEQSSKGATIIGVCDGVRVVANAGLLRNKKAVGHWYSLNDLAKEFTDTKWLSNARYVADEKVITTTGVTASIPVSIALIEAIAGKNKARAVAETLGIKNWRSKHESRKFRLNFNYVRTAALNWLSFWSKEKISIPITDGVDEIALALTADSYSRTYKSKAFSVSHSGSIVLSKRGLKILPDRESSVIKKFNHIIELDHGLSSASALDVSLSGIERLYGEATANWVALQLEYPND